MKEWQNAVLEDLSIKTTAQVLYGASAVGSGVAAAEYEDLGTCHNNYWAGNGKTLEEAKKDNPYYQGGWSGKWGD